MGELFVGLSTYSDPKWKGEGKFYPPKTKAAEFLTHYSSRYRALEADGTFYRTPSGETTAKWIAETPETFRVSPKMSQAVTHFARLKPSGLETLQAFVKALQPVENAEKLGPILVQLPPNLKRDDGLLRDFLSSIPHRNSLRWALEFRHESWNVEEVDTILQGHQVATVLAETDEATPISRDTSNQVYVRLRKLQYSDQELQAWAARLYELRGQSKACFVFCRHKEVEAPWLWADRISELSD